MGQRHQENIQRLRHHLDDLRRSTEELGQLFDDYVQSELALLHSEERFRLLVDSVAGYAIFMLDIDGQIASWNSGAQRTTGYAAAEAIGQHFSMLFPPQDIADGKSAHGLEIAAREGRYEEESWRIRKDGARFWANVVITALRNEHGELRGYSTVTRDLTERRAAEEALRRSEELFRMLVEEVGDYAIFMLDQHGFIVSWNKGAQLIKGYKAEEVIGQHFSVFYPDTADRLEQCARRLQIAADEGRYREEGWRVRKDGSRFWADVVITALRNEHGELRGFGKVTRDLTERQAAAAERERLREQELQLEREREARQQSEAMARMRSDFLVAAAHELRTPVTSLLGYAQLLKRRIDQSRLSPEQARQPLQVLIEQAQRMERLTTLLLDLSRLEHGMFHIEQGRLDLRTVVAQVVGELQTLATRHTISLSTGDDPLMILGDELRLEQVVYNLVQNAIKYSPEGGTIAVAMTAADGRAVLSVADSGLGIPAADLESIFERFYRSANATSEQIGGLGIGLFITRELVRLHGGTVEAQSTLGAGSTFTVRLPLAAPPKEQTA